MPNVITYSRALSRNVPVPLPGTAAAPQGG